MGYLERNSETLKTPGFSGFDSRVSGFSRVVIFGFGSGSGSKKVGLFPRVSGFWVQRPITTRYTFLRPSGRGVMYHKLHLMPQPAISLIYSLEIFSTIIHQFLFES